MSATCRSAWTFSTGVLRGHEGGPLVIGDVMYIHTPFPNIVYALDLNDDGRVIWKYEPKQDPNVIPVMCCDTVNRGVVYGDGKIFRPRPTPRWWRSTPRPARWSGRSRTAIPARARLSTAAPLIYKDKVYIGISGGEFGVQGLLTAYNITDGKQVWRGFSTGPDDQTLMDPREDHPSRQAGRQGQRHGDLGRRPVEDRRRHHLGLVLGRS